jgi:hypothetical protein
MSHIECTACHSMAAFPQTTTRLAAVLDYDAPNCTKYEYYTEYACANCHHHFAKSMPSHSPAPQVREMTSGGEIYDRPLPMGFRSRSSSATARYYSGDEYNYNPVDYIARNRSRRTAKRSDIKATVKSKTVSDDCCITELNMEMKK